MNLKSILTNCRAEPVFLYVTTWCADSTLGNYRWSKPPDFLQKFLREFPQELLQEFLKEIPIAIPPEICTRDFLRGFPQGILTEISIISPRISPKYSSGDCLKEFPGNFQ